MPGYGDGEWHWTAEGALARADRERGGHRVGVKLNLGVLPGRRSFLLA
jgi:hypothetical protein